MSYMVFECPICGKENKLQYERESGILRLRLYSCDDCGYYSDYTWHGAKEGIRLKKNRDVLKQMFVLLRNFKALWKYEILFKLNRHYW